MTILFFARRYLPHHGGVEKHIAGLCQALLQELPSARIILVAEKHLENLAEYEIINGIEVYRIPLPDQKINKLAIWRWLSSHFHLLQAADIIHIHDVFFWLLPFRPLLFWKKFFITFHGYEPPGPTWRQKFWHQVAELATEGSICIGGFHQKWYGVEPDSISFGAVNAARALEVRKKSIPRNLIFVGRLAEDTGVQAYLQAVKILTENKHSMSLDIYGEGPLKLELESYVQVHKLSVTFHGVTEISAQLYQKYDLALVSGYLTILESMAAGIPVIAVHQTALKKDYLSETPFANWITIVPSVTAIADQLKKAELISPEAVKWANGQTWSKLAQLYLKLWSGV